GDSLQSFVPSYLEMSMESFTKNQEEMRSKFGELFGARLGTKDLGVKDFESLTRQNLQMFDRAMRIFLPLGQMMPGASDDKAPANDASPGARDQEIRELKEQLAAMRAEIAQLARKD